MISTSPRALMMQESPNRASAAAEVGEGIGFSEFPNTAAAAASSVAADLEKDAEAICDILRRSCGVGATA
jgi:hypothetical protein